MGPAFLCRFGELETSTETWPILVTKGSNADLDNWDL